MIEEIFTAPFTRRRHRDAALLPERLAFLQGFRDAGATRHSLRQLSERLLRLVDRLPAPLPDGVDDAALQHLVDSIWQRPHSAEYRRRIELDAKRWFEFLGWWRGSEPLPAEPALSRFIDWMRNERGLHDLRHTAAMHRLVAWYQQGLDVNKLLPQLSTYMGHNGVASTQRYLHMTPDLLAQASQRFAAYACQGGDHAQS